MPEDVEEGGHFDESRTVGLDATLRNKKVGRMLSIPRELVDDDQTGQIRDRSSKLGERMRYKEEIDALNAWINARDYAGGSAGANGYTTAIGNKFSGGNTAFAQSAIENAAVALRVIKDPLGHYPGAARHAPALADQRDPGVQVAPVAVPAVGPGGQSPERDPFFTGGSTGFTMTENWLRRHTGWWPRWATTCGSTSGTPTP